MAARGIRLEVCLSSNVATGVVASFREHPARRLHDAGVPLVLNTDDPSFFHTTLAAELSLAETELGFGVEDLKTLVRNGFDFAFDREAAWNSVQGGLRDVAG